MHIARNKELSTVTHELARDVSAAKRHKHLLRWVEKLSNLPPANIHWVDGSQEEYYFLCAQIVEATFQAQRKTLAGLLLTPDRTPANVAPRRGSHLNLSLAKATPANQ